MIAVPIIFGTIFYVLLMVLSASIMGKITGGRCQTADGEIGVFFAVLIPIIGIMVGIVVGVWWICTEAYQIGGR